MGINYFIFQDNFSYTLYFGVKYRFCVRLNKIGPIDFTLTLAIHNDIIHTERHLFKLFNYCWAKRTSKERDISVVNSK